MGMISLFLGTFQELDWLREEFVQRFDVKFRGRLGPDNGDDKSIKILNRIVRCGDGAWEVEADQRHAELIVEQLGLKDSRKVSTPGSDQVDREALKRLMMNGSPSTMRAASI